MSIESIVTELRAEETRINTAIALLTSESIDQYEARTRRKKIVTGPANPTEVSVAKRKGGLTPEGRRRLALAMKKRWAARRKEAAATAAPAPKAAKRPAKKKAAKKATKTAAAAAA